MESPAKSFKRDLCADRVAEVLQQVFEAEEWMTDIGFGPIDEHAVID